MADAQEPWELAVDPANIRRTRVRARKLPAARDLQEGRILARVDRLGFSANNVLYAVLGHQNHYWDIYPTEGPWGLVPAWGYAEVIASRSPDVAAGARIFGLFPIASHAELGVEAMFPNRFRDPTPHRQGAAEAYHGYTVRPSGAAADDKLRSLDMLIRPLAMVSWLASLHFAEHAYFGARNLIISSASSKTAIALAFLGKASGAVENIIGLTSPANEAYVASLGCYDEVVPYTDVAQLAPDQKGVFFDVAGDATIRDRLHRRLGDNLAHSATVGLAHWDADHVAAPDLPGPPPTLFFAPPYMERYAREWGGSPALFRRYEEALAPLVKAAGGWLDLVEISGPEAIEATYLEFLSGSRPPNEGLVLRF
jgi:NADPH:quinone reductase-like Zn-dependent oxidoreductase